MAQPDRLEVAFLFLTAPISPRQPPEQVQVIGEGGERLQLSDTQGSDCTLERVWIKTRDHGGPEVVYATRTFSGDLNSDVASAAAPMQIRVFRPRHSETAGDSTVMLRLVSAAKRSAPVCSAADVQREMVRLSSSEKSSR